MSDTPRTDAEYDNALEFEFDSEDRLQDIRRFSKKLERELNAANERLKRLEEAGDKIVEAGWSVQDWSGMCVVWAKAKEAKP